MHYERARPQVTHKTLAYLRLSEAAKKFVLRTNVLGQILIFQYKHCRTVQRLYCIGFMHVKFSSLSMSVSLTTFDRCKEI